MTQYAEGLNGNGIVNGPDCRKPPGRTQAAFGASTGFEIMILIGARQEHETI